jgi:hypothetical protein
VRTDFGKWAIVRFFFAADAAFLMFFFAALLCLAEVICQHPCDFSVVILDENFHRGFVFSLLNPSAHVLPVQAYCK